MNGNDFAEFALVGVAMMLLWTARSIKHGNLLMYGTMVGLMEGHLWLHGQQDAISARLFQVFIATLLGLVAFHKYSHHHKLLEFYKLYVTAVGSVIMACLFIAAHEVHGLREHFLGHDKHAEERAHILYNLALLLPGFAIVSYYFEHSGACGWIERRIKSDAGVLWMVYGLSIVLDNIASAMIGGSLIGARYKSVVEHCRAQKDPRKKKFPKWLFMLLIGIVAASNLGGAPSFIGDTTTVMIYLTGVAIWVLAKGFVSTNVAQAILAKFMTTKHKEMPEDFDHTQLGRQEYVDWTWGQFFGTVGYALSLFLPWNWIKLLTVIVAGRKLFPLLGIPGLVAGNVLFDKPGLGLWSGLLIGIFLAKLIDLLAKTEGTPFSWKELALSFPNTLFLLLLVFAAKLLPLDELKPMLMQFSHDQVAILLGLLSPVFDNIPLTSLALDIGGFDWALLALSVGFGGSMLWFGSSAGVALGKKFPELENTADWFPRPFLILLGIFWVMIGVHMLVWKWIPQLLGLV